MNSSTWGSIFVAFITASLLYTTAVMADTFALKDGTVVICKVIKETDEYYVIANSYGVFTVKKPNVKKVYITRNYKEDLAIQRKMGIKVDEDIIKKNIEDGVRQKQIAEQKEKPKKKELSIKLERDKRWYYGRMGLSVAYQATVGSPLSTLAGNGLWFNITYDQGLEGIIPVTNMLIPGIRVEAGFADVEKKMFYLSQSRISGFVATAGPMWAVPYFENSWGCAVFAFMPGIGYLEAVNKTARAKSAGTHFMFTLLAGYEYSFNIVSIFAHFRYTHIMDSSHPLNGVGCDVGFACRLW
ncbi:MAG: hypothetical protein JW807_13985 [Spirochaetes bacterium]|nr:hypothetical protein [Spirochaetota bacterium]